VTIRRSRISYCCLSGLAFLLVFARAQVNSTAPPPVSAESSGSFDGPAELPRLHVPTSLASTPAAGKSRRVNSSADLQSALDAAQCGDTVELQAGAIFRGNFKLPAKSCDDSHWIVLRSSAPDASLPAEGTRVTPCYAGIASLHGLPLHCTSAENVMAQIVGQPPILADAGANHYRLIGLEITQIPGKLAYSIVNLSDSSDHIIVDRCWVHGTAADDSQVGIRFNSRFLAVVDSFVSDIHFNGADSQAVGGAAGTGPYAIINNYLEAAGENIMFGGAGATSTPSDIEIRRNHIYKPLAWRPDDPSFAGIKFTVKDLFEIKNAQRVLVEGNILENMWSTAVVITPKNQNGKCPICTAADITWRYNIVRHAGNGLTVFNAPSDSGAIAQPAQRISVHDSLFVDIDGDKWHGDGRLFVVGTCPQCQVVQDVSIRHNTATEGPRNFLWVHNPAKRPISHFVFADNIVPHGKYGVAGCEQTVSAILDRCFASLVFTKNLIVGDTGRQSYPSGQLYASDWRGVKLASTEGQAGPYRLAENSKYRKSASDGKDVGADMDLLERATAGVAQW
jgi:hypothetical protein